jgi:glycosyltransferase involved in cell wall biosynthesis
VPNIRFSVVITCFNQREFIRDAVDSALFQSVSEKEVIIVDDASTDGSRQILEQYKDAIRLAPLQSNLGPVGARNFGASLAKGDYLVFLDGDDALMPWALEAYNRIIDLKRPKMLLSRLLFFEQAMPSLKVGEVPREIEFVDYEMFIKKDRKYRACASTIVVTRNAFQDVQGWSADIFPLDDVDLVAKLGSSGRAIQIVSPPTVFYRIHANNTIHKVSSFMGMAHRLVQKVRAGEFHCGRSRRFEIYAFVGGPVAYWVKRAYSARLYGEALKLLADGWTVILAGVARRFAIRIKGRRPIETIELKTS